MKTTNQGGRRKAEGGGAPRDSLSPAPARRGVVLLIVLALLALFGLIAVAFVFIAGQAQRSAKTIERIEQGAQAVGADAKKLLNQAAMQVLRGPDVDADNRPNPGSVMRAHSLLETMYGNGSITGTITASAAVTGFGQLVNLTVAGTDMTALKIARRGGCVLTITGNKNVTTTNPDSTVAIPDLGQSTRIVGMNVSGASPIIQVLAFPDGADLNPKTNASGQTVQVSFTINDVPFSGAGFGYRSAVTPPDLDATTTPYADTVARKIALLPNLPLSKYYNAATNPLSNPPGGANTDYTAADFQHMLLAAQVPNTSATGGIQTLPSMHRPALCRYWAKQTVTSFTPDFTTASNTDGLPAIAREVPVALKRAIIARPLPDDHPNFTGSNPSFVNIDQTKAENLYQTGFNPLWDGHTAFGVTPAPFSWDVDNDGDGVPDSVWVDLGLPVRATADGRLYKPLFAILCLDLDGRLNLNAHGSIQQTDSNYSTLTSNTLTNLVAADFAGGAVPTTPPRGQGFGPAEISLLPVLNSDNTLYTQVLTGGTTGYEGRYGNGSVPGASGLDTVPANAWFDYGPGRGESNYWDFTNVKFAGSYGTPPDPFGVGAVALDPAGRPIYAGCKSGSDYVGFGSNLQNNPYETNLGLGAPRGLGTGSVAADNLFSPAELERVIRPFDRDAPSLPSRLALLTASGTPSTSVLATLTNRLAVTTDSWDVPCPAASAAPLTTAQRQKLITAGITDGRVRHVTDLLIAHGITDKTHWAQLLPPEMLVGLKMNVNQPLGNGQDELGNGVVDSPAETNTQDVKLSGTTVNTFSFDGRNDGTTTSLAARQREARFLYVIACLTVDLPTLKTSLGASTSNDDVARFLAQWAVNVVDFRDRDSIMTPFKFDAKFANPAADLSTGWAEPTDAKYLVWGCERPELLISETLAFHDRRTEDTDREQIDTTEQDNTSQESKSKVDASDPKKDHSFDQARRPQGSLFIELYNPQSPREPRSGELCTAPNGNLDLTKTTPPVGTTKGSPVWRLMIARPQYDTGNLLDPDDARGFADASKWPTMEREVYFVNSANATIPTKVCQADKAQFSPSVSSIDTSTNKVTVPPGGYAVIGPGEGTNKRTYIGFRDGATAGDANTRYIDLNLTAPPLVKHNTNTQSEPGSSTVSNVATLAIDYPNRLSVSEPLLEGTEKDYDKMEEDIPGNVASGAYTIPYDIPFDMRRTDPDAPVFKSNKSTAGYRVVYLQRLANPLEAYNNDPTSADYNPYRTIDMMPIDLTTFNGVTSETDPQVTAGEIHFQTRQRGEHNDAINATSHLNTNMNLWAQEPIAKTYTDATLFSDAGVLSNDSIDASAIQTHYFTSGLKHSFGYLNQPFGSPQATPQPGDPSQPFPWLNWNNRPYVSPLELLQVPVLQSSCLLSATGNCHYTMAQTDDPYQVAYAPFGHLINLFKSGTTGTADRELHRVLEYLTVPSPFAATDIWANPTLAASSTGHAYHPPFNRISTYREPGRININTLYGDATGNRPPTWKGLMAGFGGMDTDTYWRNFVNSRRPSGDIDTNCLAMPANQASPTEFARPFRSFAGPALVPTVSGDPLKPNREIDATLMRSDGDPTNPQPFFRFTSSDASANTSRNPYFHYQGLQRLSNLVTTRSNVYAVWITVGYFEVSPVTTADLNRWPDGYQLGRELGMDTGEIERHRAFYIFDRTIPVGFQRGQDLNVEKAILVNRFIE